LEERRLESILGGGSAPEARSPREQELPARTKPSGSREGDGSSGGRKPLKRGYQAEKV